MVSSLEAPTEDSHSSNSFGSCQEYRIASSLLHYIDVSTSQLNEWVEEEKARIDKAWDNHRQRVEKEQAEVDAQVANLLAIQLERGCIIHDKEMNHDENSNDPERRVADNSNNTSLMAKKVQELQEQSQSLRADISKLQEKQQQRLEQLQDVTQEKERQRAKAEAILIDKNEREAAKRARLDKYTKIILLYQQHLGFHYEKAENLSLRLWFTLLDGNDPTRKFSFRLSVDDQDTFVVQDCQPPIPSDTLERLLKQINDTDRGQDDFSQLILSMRKFVWFRQLN